MKKLLSVIATLGVLVSSESGTARNPLNTSNSKPQQASYKTEAGDCRIPVSQYDLSINNVRCKLLNAGDMWWDLDNAKYEVPKGDGQGVAINAIFAGAIWVSALDAGGNLKIAAQLYRSGNTDFWAGPLDDQGSVSSSVCDLWDRHFNVMGSEIRDLQNKGVVSDNLANWPGRGNKVLAAQGFNMNNNLATFFDTDDNGIYEPEKGDYPVIPFNSQAKPSTFADQMIFWVMNDKGNAHTATTGQPMGIQINALAFAFQSTDDINNMTFYNYGIWNKSGGVFNRTCMSQFVDADLGCSDNDRIGCDVDRSLAIIYNGEKANGKNPKCDEGTACLSGTNGYGCELPIMGLDFFEGPVDTTGRKLGMSAFTYFTRPDLAPNPGQGDPTRAAEFRNYQTGFWKDGTPITYGGTGYGFSSTRIPYVYPGDPADATQWSECNPQLGPNIVAGDRRFLMTASPFTFLDGRKQNITVGVVWVRPNGGIGSTCPNFNTAIGRADDLAQALFDGGFKLLDGPASPTLQIRELDQQVIINLVNEAGTNNYAEKYDEVGRLFAKNGVNGFTFGMDSTYTFEGYKIYQLANDKISATDLNEPVDPSKAVLVAQMDVKNGVARVINFEKDPLTGFDVPVVKVDGQDKGITHSVPVSTDFVKGGNLVNYKTYYYAAVAYAVNEYKVYDPNNPTAGGQKFPYLQGSKNFARYSAIPHPTDPRNGGTQLNAIWGSSAMVDRIEGQGNSGNNINIIQATTENILAHSNQGELPDTLHYEVGFDPIGLKIVDPIMVKENNFELRMEEDSFYTYRTFYKNVLNRPGLPDTTVFSTAMFDVLLKGQDPADSAVKAGLNHPVDSVAGVVSRSASLRWKLNEYDHTNNTLVQTISAENYLDKPYEQLIYGKETGSSDLRSYGFSLKMGNPNPVYSKTTAGNVPVYGPIGGSIEYADSRNPWLSFVKDAGQNDASNWIRSGTYAVGTSDPMKNVFDDNWFGTIDDKTDAKKYFEKIAEGTWGPYCLTPNFNIGSSSLTQAQIDAGVPPATYGPGFKWRRSGYQDADPPQNNLERLRSVDIVLTNDKSKWSRCVVFEEGENPLSNEGSALFPSVTSVNAKKGMIRMHFSWDKNTNRYLDDITPGVVADTGRSWFPGYAINVETGERLNICFGEASEWGDQNGRDMLWNPTAKVYGDLNTGGSIPNLPYFGGKHFIYVSDTKYDEGASMQRVLLDNYQFMGNNNSADFPAPVRELYKSLMWTSIPYLTAGYKLRSVDEGLIPSNVTIRLRVDRPLERLMTKSTPVDADSLPRYRFSTVGLGAKENVESVAKTALDLIRIVPNPYLAASAYERSISENRIKITNLPNRCDIAIYTLDGTLVRKLTRSVSGVDPETNKPIDISDGANIDATTSNPDNTIFWDLTNDKNTPVSSGIYIFDIQAPGIGHKILKWFGAMRPTDVSSF
ncbi:MAG: hypothetical protein U0T84_12800 [Chitinophagales bacterium]